MEHPHQEVVNTWVNLNAMAPAQNYDPELMTQELLCLDLRTKEQSSADRARHNLDYTYVSTTMIVWRGVSAPCLPRLYDVAYCRLCIAL